MDPLLKKLFFKGQKPVLLLGAPPELKSLSRAFGVPLDTTPKGKYGFILAFVKSIAEGERLAKRLSKLAADGAVLWVAYPKGTSKKYQSDYNRDSGHAMMAKKRWDGVSLIALDEDWSAMRFKRI